MALTQFEKDCIDDVHTHLVRKSALTAQEQSDLDDIKHGDDAARQAVITSWINSGNGIAAVDAEIAAIDAGIVDLNTRKTALQTKKTDMENYVA